VLLGVIVKTKHLLGSMVGLLLVVAGCASEPDEETTEEGGAAISTASEDFCSGHVVVSGESTYETEVFIVSDASNKRIGDIACDQARKDAEQKCRKKPYWCNAVPSETRSFNADCGEGSNWRRTKCTCTATTKCTYTN
jgi:hypothetical protein